MTNNIINCQPHISIRPHGVIDRQFRYTTNPTNELILLNNRSRALH